ncbi:butyrophilin subfamily 3 member A3 isoform X1 [Mustela putorius furo]|uniref:Butyrophilin subfamily 3 member A3 isoform X1 n=1 Tax=Mustela putorius furo TaxID=9669 RepID=A0A8U0UN95_MUSPF|nr:butyrophilin subfamily 3 member A3 isoform X1 [Mustela putorius furo]
MEDCCRDSLLIHLPSLLLLLQLPAGGSAEDFMVIGPSEPIVAVLDGDITLPCCVSPAMDVENMELWWFRSKFSEAVLIYQNQREQREEQLAQYRGRTSLVKDFLTQGDAAVLIHNVQAFDNGLYTCFFRMGIFYEEASVELKVAEPFFPRSSPWKLAFMVILTVLMLLLLGAVFYIMREHTTKLQEMQEWEKLHREKEEDQRIKEEALKARDELQGDLDWRKSVYLAALKKAQLYADWWKEKFQALSVSLDPESAHSSLAISDDKTSVTFKDSPKDTGETYSVLGHEDITSGCCYWEVEIRNAEEKSEWALGVCRRGVERKGWYQECPGKGFWVVGVYENKVFSLPDNSELLVPVPQRVGVFLDLKEGDVSFYNMTDGSHIFSFPLASSSEILFPYFG